MRFPHLLLSSTVFFTSFTILFVIPVIPTDTDDEHLPENRNELFTLSIIHMNDFHARFDEVNEKMFPCMNDVCIGGIARVKTVVDSLRGKHKNVIFLNAGDNYQGTFWYTMFRHNVTSHFLNLLSPDAITLGKSYACDSLIRTFMCNKTI
jgi:2',3'-cyclic-nucleotide 2'-phosphodiesterase (5'-nucleotidase family)